MLGQFVIVAELSKCHGWFCCILYLLRLPISLMGSLRVIVCWSANAVGCSLVEHKYNELYSFGA